MIFRKKIQQSGMNFIRFRTSGGSNRNTNKIIIISVEKVTQLSVLLSHSDKSSDPAHKQTKRQMEKGRIKRQIFLCFSENVLEVGDRKRRGKWKIMQCNRCNFMMGTW